MILRGWPGSDGSAVGAMGGVSAARSVRGSGALPTTAASDASGVSGFMNAAFGVRFFAGAFLATAFFTGAAFFAAGAFLAGAAFFAVAFLAGAAFFAGAFLAAAFFAGAAFFAATFFAGAFFTGAFFAAFFAVAMI